MPCFLVDDDACDGVQAGSCDNVVEAANELIEQVQARAPVQIAPEALHMTPHTPDHEYCLECVVGERAERVGAEPGAATVSRGGNARKFMAVHLVLALEDGRDDDREADLVRLWKENGVPVS